MGGALCFVGTLEVPTIRRATDMLALVPTTIFNVLADRRATTTTYESGCCHSFTNSETLIWIYMNMHECEMFELLDNLRSIYVDQATV